jgi:hypothetical protein
MNKFDILYKQLMEQMVAGGASSMFGSPAGGEVGSHGGQVGSTDFWNTNSNVLAKSIFGRVQSRNLNIKTGKKRRKK